MSEDELKILKDMFSGESEIELNKVQQNMSMNEAIDYLLQQNFQASTSSILSHHAAKMIYASDELIVEVNRAVIFTKTLSLYKVANHEPSVEKINNR